MADATADEATAAAQVDPGAGVMTYSCRMCRKVLYLGSHIVPHEPGSGETDFSWRKREQRVGALPQACTSHFVERLDWMGAMDAVEGKLFCSHCNAKVGSYNWAGAQCSCGRWMRPSIQLATGRVDGARRLAPPADVPQAV